MGRHWHPPVTSDVSYPARNPLPALPLTPSDHSSTLQLHNNKPEEKSRCSLLWFPNPDSFTWRHSRGSATTSLTDVARWDDVHHSHSNTTSVTNVNHPPYSPTYENVGSCAEEDKKGVDNMKVRSSISTRRDGLGILTRRRDVDFECLNCGAMHTPIWRRGLNGERNCNVCGLYYELVCFFFSSLYAKFIISFSISDHDRRACVALTEKDGPRSFPVNLKKP